MKTLQKKIMRRIYYAFALRTVATPGVFQGFAMLGILIALTYFVSLGNVIENMVNVGWEGVGTFAYHAITNTEAWTLLLLGAFIFSALSFRFKIAHWNESPKFVKVSL